MEIELTYVDLIRLDMAVTKNVCPTKVVHGDHARFYFMKWNYSERCLRDVLFSQ